MSWRQVRDSTLAAPKPMDQALQVNIRAGQLLKASEAGFGFCISLSRRRASHDDADWIGTQAHHKVTNVPM